jgi:hypothetical protein
MATSSEISLIHQSADSVVKSFVRNRLMDQQSFYTDMSIIGSPTIQSNTLALRASSKGPVTSPSTQKNAYNMNRSISIMGADGKVYTASVNLTVAFPGGNVISSAALESMVEDIVILAVNFNGANSPSSGMVAEGYDISPFINQVRILGV